MLFRSFASALVFARLLVCLVAIASFSKSAPRLSRCLHHHEPGARARQGGDQGGGRRHRQQCSLWRRSRVERQWQNDFFGGAVSNWNGSTVADHRPSINQRVQGSSPCAPTKNQSLRESLTAVKLERTPFVPTSSLLRICSVRHAFHLMR